MLNLTAGGLSGGYKKYLQRLVPLLHSHPAISEMLVAVPPGFEKMRGIGDGALSWEPGDHWKRYPALRTTVRSWKPDVVLIPTARFLDCGAPVVSMVRNMQPMLPPTFRDGLPAWAKNHAGAIIAKRACHASTRVIAVSHYVRDYLVDKWDVDPRRVGVVYHGVDEAESFDTPEILRSLENTPYVFAAGSLLPYRGLEDAVGALAHLNASVKLVVAGDGSAPYKERILAQASALGVTSRIVWLGHVNEAIMTSAFRQCIAFLMTSRVEACPNTALEAMASGALCISTTCPPMPEFFAKDALYYEAGDDRALAEHIKTVANTSANVAQQTRLNVQHRAAEFTWEKTVNGTVRELDLALKNAGIA